MTGHPCRIVKVSAERRNASTITTLGYNFLSATSFFIILHALHASVRSQQQEGHKSQTSKQEKKKKQNDPLDCRHEECNTGEFASEEKPKRKEKRSCRNFVLL
jgi:hypothetical protein